jgi:hypothetical protein
LLSKTETYKTTKKTACTCTCIVGMHQSGTLPFWGASLLLPYLTKGAWCLNFRNVLEFVECAMCGVVARCSNEHCVQFGAL